MECVYCGSGTQVTNSRPKRRSNDIWRRRQCKTCKNIFTTTETIDLASAIRVEINPGLLVPFEASKLLTSIYDCCKHIKNPAITAQELTLTVIKKVIKRQNAILSRQELIALTYDTLRQFDQATAVQFRAFHK